MRAYARRWLTVMLAPMLVIMLWGPAAHAAVSAQDWQTPGDGLLTLDTATGLQWLDVTVTQGLAWDVVTSQLAAGGRLAGFRRPSDAEIATFWADAGIPDISPGGSFNPTAANFQPVRALQQLWGDTGLLPFGPPGATATWVTSSESFDPIDRMVEGTAIFRLFESEGIAAAQLRALLGAPPDQPVPLVAHALIVSPVPAIPEPSALVLLFIGIATGSLMRILGGGVSASGPFARVS